MRELDFSPLFRTGVGFDRMAQLLDAMASENASGYPPYNIEKLDDNSYRITMAVAGFSETELTVEVRDNQLRVSGLQSGDENAESNRVFLHRGIAERGFERRFSLAEHIRVDGANLEKGLLHIALKREVPDALKPRTISIAVQDSGSVVKSLENRRAA